MKSVEVNKNKYSIKFYLYWFYNTISVYGVKYMIISSIGYDNYSGTKRQTAFTGFTKQLSRRIFVDGQKDISKLLEKYPNKYPVCGQLPEFITYKLPKEIRKSAIHEIFEAFDKVTMQLRGYTPDSTSSINEILKSRPDSAVEILNNVFKKYKIIRPFVDDDIDIVYLDKGGKGAVYKIEGLKGWTSSKVDKMFDDPDEFVIKVYHQIKGEGWHPFKSHGAWAESNSANYWTKHEGRYTQRGKFYFAGLKSGYMVNKFLDEDTRLPKRVVDEYSRGIKCTDEDKYSSNKHVIDGYNRIKGYNYDWGGCRVVNRVKNENKIALTILNRIKNTPEKEVLIKWQSLFAQKQNKDDIRAGLALAIKYIPRDCQKACIEQCLELNRPKVNQALAYVLKYLQYEDSVPYYKKLLQTNDVKTQVILLNEIPLMSKKLKPDAKNINDDITAQLAEIVPERIERYYNIAERYAHPDAIEHLASFVHLLPRENIPRQYEKLVKLDNESLHERLLYTLGRVPKFFVDDAKVLLRKYVQEPRLRELYSDTFKIDSSG